jgi:hypothetical protein
MKHMTNKNYLQNDIQDSPQDQEKLKPEETTLDLPELKDIPGGIGATKDASLLPGDTTVSSSDEEGDDILGDEDDLTDDNNLRSENDVSPVEKKLLRDSLDPSYDTDLPIHSLSLDQKDNEGVPLNESGLDRDLFGEDLDTDLVEQEDEESENDTSNKEAV